MFYKNATCRQFAIVLVANLSALITGYMVGWFSPMEPRLRDPAQTPLALPLTRDQAAWLAAITLFGAILGPSFGGLASLYVGRKWCLTLSSIPFLTSWVLLAASSNIFTLYAARFLLGMAAGMVLCTLPMYGAEIASVDVRGALGSITSLGLESGTLLAFAMGPYISYDAMTYVGVALSSLFALLMYWMPETPAFYLMKGDRNSAEESLSITRGKNSKMIQRELQMIENEVDLVKEHTFKVSDLWNNKVNMKSLAICGTLLALQPFGGSATIQTYAQDIFINAGVALEPHVAVMIYGAVQCCGPFITLLVVDRLGRRLLLLISTMGMAVTLGLFAVYSMTGSARLGVLPVVLLCVNIVLYSAGFGPLTWILVGELFSVKIRPQASVIVTTIHWTVNFIIVRYFYSIVDGLGLHVAFWIFAGCCALACAFVYLVVPETKGKSLQEIQDLLGN